MVGGDSQREVVIEGSFRQEAGGQRCLAVDKSGCQKWGLEGGGDRRRRALDDQKWWSKEITSNDDQRWGALDVWTAVVMRGW